MTDGIVSADWTGRFAVVAFPEHVDASTAPGISDQLRAAVGKGTAVVIADMSATAWCDRAGVDALMHAYQLAAVSNAELRLVVREPAVGRVVSDAGLDRLVAVFRSVEAAAAGDRGGYLGPDDAVQRAFAPQWAVRPRAGQSNGSGSVELNAAVLRQLIDTLDDGIMLADDDGTIVLASRRLAAMFGYEDGELTGQPVEALVPPGLRGVHREDRAAYARAPVSRPMAGRVRLVGVRKDGATLPVTITLSPVPTASGHFILAVVRDATRAPRLDDLASLARAAASDRDKRSEELLDRVVSSLFHVGISLQAAAHQPAQVARERITDALLRLDEVIHEIRDHVFRARSSGNGQ
ncbi:MAG: PAS domain S-box protein [Streptosporangiaceae bacterium]